MTSRTDTSAANRRLVEALSALSRTIFAITARTLAALDVDLTLSQHRALVVLASRGPQRSVDLAAELGVHPSTVSRTCDRLIRRGLVQRRRSPADQRVSLLALTEPGKQLIGEVMRRRSAQLRTLVTSRSLDHAIPVVPLLDELVAASGELPERQWWTHWARSTSGAAE